MIRIPVERHYTGRRGWLRAAVLGANDGILSTASLVIGVASAQSSQSEVMVAGMAGLVAGAMSMAAGEFVSVSSQADTENADIEREKRELKHNHLYESEELAEIYVNRGLDESLAREVADQLMAHDALGAHVRDELGIIDEQSAKPAQAALASASMFALGASLPMLLSFFSPLAVLPYTVAGGSLLSLALLGALAARAGGAPLARGASRVFLWGALAMAVTAAIGTAFGHAV